MGSELAGRDEIRDANEILSRREESRIYLESRVDRFSESYPGDTAVVVTTGEGPELAAVYDGESEKDWGKLIAEQLREAYSEITYLSAVERKLE